MIELGLLRSTTLEFLSLTDELLACAQQGRWDEFFGVQDARDQQLALLLTHAGDTLLSLLPDLRSELQQALDNNLRIDGLVRARRDELVMHLSSVQHQRRLNSTYRSG